MQMLLQNLWNRRCKICIRLPVLFYRGMKDVADAISDTILVCWEKIDTLKKNRFFRTWMTRILINKCNDILRAGQRTVFTDEPLEIEYMENEFLNWNGF